MPTNWKATCAYEGTPFSGFQSQKSRDGIQDIIEAQLLKIFKTSIRLHGSGRTDAGVHAKAQVFHFKADWPHSPQELLMALNCKLHPAIQIYRVTRAPQNFHARFSAKSKHYSYRIHSGNPRPWERPYCYVFKQNLNSEAMQKAAAGLLGTHEFVNFSAGSPEDKPSNTTRTLQQLDIRCVGSRIRIDTKANGYLYKMVRKLVGGLIAVGQARLSAEDLHACLSDAEKARGIITAPAQGLWLEKVFYA